MDNMTAKVSCFARAYHYKYNDVCIFSDEKAEQLLGEDYEQIATNMINGISFFFPGFNGTHEEGLRLIVDKQLSPSVLGRSAFCEKMLKGEIRLGCRQYLILAAGYDTFALRNQTEELMVYELDLPELIADKQKRISDSSLKSCAVYVPCDLSNADWIEFLLAKGFNPEDKSFASLLGISYYLEKEDFADLICALSRIMKEGSALCFDYPSFTESRETKTNSALAKGAGEEMKSLYTLREIEIMLSTYGFNIYEHLDSHAMTEQYFSEYNKYTHNHQIVAPDGIEYVIAVKE